MKKDYIGGNTTKYLNQQKRNRDFAAFMIKWVPVVIVIAAVTTWWGA